ncbi:MAG: hypothetical protein CHACPFDD_01498 [Phycisphaerae bacterium]|nr:hypothetical protein [Phycisphaerae bacterium]
MFVIGVVEWLAQLDKSTLRLVILAALGALVVIVWVVAVAWRRVRESASRASVTAELIRRGMSADEIVRVLLAAQLAEEAEGGSGAADDPEVLLVKHLTDNHYEGEDVQRILDAAREEGGIDDRLVALVKTMASSWVDTESIIGVIRGRGAGKPTAISA